MDRKQIRGILGILLIAFVSMQANAQMTFRAQLDSTAMPIGCQNSYQLILQAPRGEQIILPTLGDTLVRGVEVLELSPVDTISNTPEQIELRLQAIITSFDSALYLLPPQYALVGGDTVWSNPTALKIMTYQLDSASMAIFDVKGVMSPPLVMMDFILWVVVPLLVLLLIIASYYIYEVFARRTESDEAVTAEPLIPAHQEALLTLDRIKEEQLWLQGESKQYYTQLTDALRRYLSRRYGVDAMELTSGEILVLVRKADRIDPVLTELKDILSLADLVKFAKWIPDEHESQTSLRQAYLFVETTMAPTEEELAALQASSEGQEEPDADLTQGEDVAEEGIAPIPAADASATDRAVENDGEAILQAHARYAPPAQSNDLLKNNNR